MKALTQLKDMSTHNTLGPVNTHTHRQTEEESSKAKHSCVSLSPAGGKNHRERLLADGKTRLSPNAQ